MLDYSTESFSTKPDGTYRFKVSPKVAQHFNKTLCNYISGNYIHHQVWKVSQYDSCKPHHFCPSWLGNRKKFFACGYGFYNLKRDSKSSDDCLPCPAGKYCLAGVYDCEPGYYCPENGLPKEPWPGYYAPNAGMSEPLECPPGTFQPFVQHKQWEWRGITECISCPLYMFCDGTRLIKPTGYCENGYSCGTGETVSAPAEKPCPPGFFCYKGEWFRCLAGKYQPYEYSIRCLDCPEGMYCSRSNLTKPTGSCDPGWYCERKEINPRPLGKICPAGFMCPDGKKTPCGFGYYQPNTQQTTCLLCPVGKYCSTTQLTSPSGDCNSGCCQEAGQISPSSCPPENPTPCSQGSYELDGICKPCPEGMYCAVSGLSAPSGQCSPQWYCESGEITPSPLGKYCPAGYQCPNGIKLPCGKVGNKYFYQPFRGQTKCVLCRDRYNCSQPASHEEVPLCLPGYNCHSGLILPCEVGKYCVGGLMKTCLDGFEQPNSGQGACVRCPEGFICQNAKRSPCPENRVCFNGIAHYCELGYECTFVNGKNVKTPCPPGTERYELDSPGCVPCRKHRYCRSASSYECFRYHEGFFCNGGADKPFLETSLPGEYYSLNEIQRGYTREICPPGTYTPDMHNSQCLPCPYGKYCDAYNLAEPSGTCSPGYYCTEGSTTKTQNVCPVGYVCVNGNVAFCPAGYYCSSAGLSLPTGICPSGHKCPEGSTAPVPCPEGTQQPNEGAYSCY